ncbi:ABC-2 type transport system permease protein [Leucobacter exalbidus]|uniref:ABC-2 type transport system permease protein n=1 Tax=Leucobacter exalbidus TaxID=662960 RepID=A0A940PUI1_9MICO|nr:ABC transporter permease [Leucobacter exalbidus]MBP1325476.1 ABC-2 type transport system permease protein [Leucobacter exalbidus]
MIHVLIAELTKTFTLRSIQATLAAALVIPPALALTSGLAFDPLAPAAAAFPIESHGFETAGFGQPLVILLAALITGTEYLDGQLRTTLLATPGRGRVLATKFAVIAALSAMIGLISTSAAVLVKHAALGEYGLSVGMFTTEMVWNILSVAVNYALIALIAASITILARSLIVTLVVLVPLVLGLTISLLGAVPILKYLPDLTGIQLLTTYPGIGLLDPISGGLVMAGWAGLLSGAAWIIFRTRDANG